MVNELYEKAWLPMRNYFTPVMKLVSKERIGGKVRKKYDKPASPCDRLLTCEKVSEAAKKELRQKRSELDLIDLAEEVQRRLSEIFRLVERIDEERWEEMERAGEVGGANFPQGWTALRLRSLPLPVPPLHPTLRKSLLKHHQRTITQPSAGCHE